MEIQFRVRGLDGPIQGSKIGDGRLSSDPGPSASDNLQYVTREEWEDTPPSVQRFLHQVIELIKLGSEK